MRVAEIMQEREGWVDSIHLHFERKPLKKVSNKWKLEHKGGIQGKTLQQMKDFLRNER